MRKDDDLAVLTLGILRGALSPPPSMHEVLARSVLGTALGTLAIDAKLPDSRILTACRAALDHRELSLSTPFRELPAELRGETPHQDLAYKLVRVAVQEGDRRSFVADCRRILTQIRIAAGDDNIVQQLRDAQLAAANAKPRDG